MNRMNKVTWLLRIGVAGTFIGHGLVAWNMNPVWIPYLTSVGFSVSAAKDIMPIIGAVDIVVGLMSLVMPLRVIFLYGAIWAFAAALIRPISGTSILAFVERAANWIVPLTLFVIGGMPKSVKDLFQKIKID